MFLLKKIITAFLLPLNLCLVFLVCGLLLILITKKQRIGKILVTAGIVLLLLLSFPPLSWFLIFSLESRYPYVSDETLAGSQIRWIVVLGGGHNSSRPKSAQLSPSSLARVVEAVRIYKEKPGMKMILSGGSVFDPLPNAKAMADTARMLGVRQEDMVLEVRSRDTEEEAKFLSMVLKNEPFYLVTSASHMPRAVALFQGQKTIPLPAPTDYSFQSQSPPFPLRYLPNPGSLSQSEKAIREYMGIGWSKLRGRT